MSSIGDDIIDLFADAAINEAVKIGTKVLMPTTYQVYLHKDDYKKVMPIFPQIREETRKRFEYRVKRNNRFISLKKNFLSLFIPMWLADLWEPAERLRNPAEWIPPRDGWQILSPIVSPDVEEGEPGIGIQLVLPQRGDVMNGNMTRSIRISGRDRKRVVTDTIGYSTARSDDNRFADSTVADSFLTETDFDAGLTYAVIRYRDEEGEKEYRIRKERVIIGRGSYDKQVDVEVATSNKVSRQHCVIKRDSRGKFLIEDTSKEGTWLGEEKVDPEKAAVLPPKARISLAKVLDLEFEVADAQRTI